MKGLLKFGIKKNIRSKKNRISIICISFIIVFCFILNTVNVTTNNYMKKDIYGNYYHRTLLVNKNMDIVDENTIQTIKNDIESIEHIDASFIFQYYFNGGELKELTNYLDGQVQFISANNNSLLKIVYGTNFPNDDGYYMVCPENFYPLANEENIKYLSSKDKYNLKDKIGEIFTYQGKDWVKGESFSISIKLVGLYKNSPNIYDENTCFVTENVNEYIVENHFKNDFSYNLEDQLSFVAVIDDVRNVDIVTKSLQENGFFVDKIAIISIEYFDKIYSVINICWIILLSLSLIFMIVYVIKDYLDNKKYYKLLKILGYNNYQIFLSFIIELLIKLIFSFILSIMILLLISIAIKIILFYKPFIFHKWSIIIDYKFLIPLFIAIFIIYLLIYSIILFFRKEK